MSVSVFNLKFQNAISAAVFLRSRESVSMMSINPRQPIQQRKKPALRLFTGLAGSLMGEAKSTAVEGPFVCPRCKTKKLYQTTRLDGTVIAECRSNRTIPEVCGYTMVWNKRALMEKEARRPGRPSKYGVPMTAAARKAWERNNKPLLEKALVEQKIDKATGGSGGGMIMPDAEEGKGQLVTGGGLSNDVLLGKPSPELDFGGRRVQASGQGVDDAHDANDELVWSEEPKEREGKFQRQQRFKLRQKWSFDDRDKEELAREMAPGFIEHLDPRTCFQWDGQNFVEWEGYVCRICLRVFGFESYAVNHIIDRVTEEKSLRHKPHRRIVQGIQPGAGLREVRK
jgi:hypothetical protein